MTAAPPKTFILERMQTPIGEALIITDADGVVRGFNWTDYEGRMRAWLARRYVDVELNDGCGPAHVRGAFKAYFSGELEALRGLAWRASGTDFQRTVWNALMSIPAGETLSYGGLAERIGRPSAVRAVGLANGANPLSLIVPCHRVIGADGSLTGYGGGLERKRWLLAHERPRKPLLAA